MDLYTQLELVQAGRIPGLEQKLVAFHAEYGVVGSLAFLREDDQIRIEYLQVEEAFRRQGVASWLMRHLESFHPFAVINHGARTAEGRAWATHFYGTAADNCRMTCNGQAMLAESHGLV